MNTLTVALPGREYEIAIQRGLLSQAGERIRAVLPRARRLAVVTDTNVGPLYYNKVKAGLERAGFELGLFSLPAGKKAKTPPSFPSSGRASWTSASPAPTAWWR